LTGLRHKLSTDASLHCDLERLLVAEVVMRVHQPRHDFVNGIIRHNHAAVDAGSAFKMVKDADGKCRQVAIQFQRVLAFREFRHQVVHLLAERLVPCRDRHSGHGGQIMPRHMPPNKSAVPTAISAGHAAGLGQACQRPIVEQQLVAIERRQISPAMQFLPVVERTAGEQPHVGRVHHLDRAGGRFGLGGGGERDEEERDSREHGGGVECHRGAAYFTDWGRRSLISGEAGKRAAEAGLRSARR
jgi:hypothetical protein